MSNKPEPLPQTFQITLPPENEEGHYADFASVWHGPDTFFLDFVAVTRPPEVKENEQGARVRQVNARIVTRVRIPASQVWEVMKALEKQLSMWEQETQTTRRPGQ